jgi:hypothetical protein
MLRDDMPHVLDAATERGVDATSEAELFQVARWLT